LIADECERVSDGEYRVKLTLRNNLLLSAIENYVGIKGHGAQSAFASAAGIGANEVNKLVAMREPPINESGEFSIAAKAIMEALGACPSDLWTDRQLLIRLRRNTGEVVLGEAAVERLALEHYERNLLPSPEEIMVGKSSNIELLLEGLTKRERKVITLLYGLDEAVGEFTLEEIGTMFDVTRERVRQIERRAVSRIKNKALRLANAEAGHAHGLGE
jgi:RNA polymerase sigma factor (sigma-70 family)